MSEAARPTSVIVFEAASIVSYGGVWLVGWLTEGFDLFDSLFYGALLWLALAVTRLRKKWARIANTLFLALSLIVGIVTGVQLLTVPELALFRSGTFVLIGGLVLATLQFVSLWHRGTSDWLSRPREGRSGVAL